MVFFIDFIYIYITFESISICSNFAMDFNISKLYHINIIILLLNVNSSSNLLELIT